MRQDQHRCRHSNVASCILYCMLWVSTSHVLLARNAAAMVQAETMCMLSLPQRLSHVAKAILAYSHWYVFENTAVVQTVFSPQDLAACH